MALALFVISRSCLSLPGPFWRSLAEEEGAFFAARLSIFPLDVTDRLCSVIVDFPGHLYFLL